MEKWRPRECVVEGGKGDRLRRKREKEAKEEKEGRIRLVPSGRGKRQKMMPLQFWLGERVEYRPGADMPSDMIGICRP